VAEAVEAAGAAAAAVRAELARTPPAVAVELALDWSADDWGADASRDASGAAGADALPGVDGSSCGSRSSGAGSGRSGPAACGGAARRGSAAPGEGCGRGGSAGRGAGCRVRVQLRPEPFHEALVATQRVRSLGGPHRVPMAVARRWVAGTCSAAALLPHPASHLAQETARPGPGSSPAPELMRPQELGAELAAARRALADAQRGFAALVARFGDSAAALASDADFWRELAPFVARFTAAQRQARQGGDPTRGSGRSLAAINFSLSRDALYAAVGTDAPGHDVQAGVSSRPASWQRFRTPSGLRECERCESCAGLYKSACALRRSRPPAAWPDLLVAGADARPPPGARAAAAARARAGRRERDSAHRRRRAQGAAAARGRQPWRRFAGRRVRDAAGRRRGRPLRRRWGPGV
jgi:hypothetical protein